MRETKRERELSKFRNSRNLPAFEKAGRMSPTRRGKRVLPLVDFNSHHRIHREFRKGPWVYERSELDIKLRLITFKTGEMPPDRKPRPPFVDDDDVACPHIVLIALSYIKPFLCVSRTIYRPWAFFTTFQFLHYKSHDTTLIPYN